MRQNILQRRRRNQGEYVGDWMDVPDGTNAIVASVPRSDLANEDDACWIHIEITDGDIIHRFGAQFGGKPKVNWRNEAVTENQVGTGLAKFFPTPSQGLKCRYRLKANYRSSYSVDIEFQ